MHKHSHQLLALSGSLPLLSASPAPYCSASLNLLCLPGSCKRTPAPSHGLPSMASGTAPQLLALSLLVLWTSPGKMERSRRVGGAVAVPKSDWLAFGCKAGTYVGMHQWTCGFPVPCMCTWKCGLPAPSSSVVPSLGVPQEPVAALPLPVR